MAPAGTRDWASAIGLGLVGAFNAWTAWFIITYLDSHNIGWWVLATATPVAGCALELAAWSPGRWAVAIGLSGNAAMRLWFLLTGGWDGLASAVPWGLAVALAVATLQAARGSPGLRWGLTAVTAFVGLVLLRQLGQGQTDAALRQSLHLAGVALLAAAAWRASPPVPSGQARGRPHG